MLGCERLIEPSTMLKGYAAGNTKHIDSHKQHKVVLLQKWQNNTIAFPMVGPTAILL